MVSNKTDQSKIRIIIEIVICYLLMLIMGLLFNRLSDLLHTDSLWMGILPYAFVSVPILIYVSRVEKKPMSSIGLYRVTVNGILIGVTIGIVMFLAQQVPFLIMGIDYQMFASPPDWQHILVMSIYCIVCVGFTEEVMLRGFIINSMIISKTP